MKSWLKGGLVTLVVGGILIAISFGRVITKLDLDFWQSLAKIIPLIILVLMAFFLFGVIFTWFIEKLNKLGRKK